MIYDKCSRSRIRIALPEFSVIKKRPSLCSACKTYPCIITYNSSRRFRTCPCTSCLVNVMCNQPCQSFTEQVEELFQIKIYWNYKKDREW